MHRLANGNLLRESQSLAVAKLLRLANLLVDDLWESNRTVNRPTVAQSWSTLLVEALSEVATEISGVTVEVESSNSAAAKVVRNAEDFIWSELPDISTIADIANACDVSVRTLELAFKKVKGASPKQVLERVRLQVARRLLITSDGPGSVLEVCNACGIGHQGRFALAYKAAFDESPVSTLRRR
jgi:transcriptional regulator GlxA family with amidase domain